jgi:GNAT superfamily N-acetyltransferase
MKVIQLHFGEVEISDDRGRLDFATVHAWLAGTYWSPGIGREQVERAAQHSAVVVGAYVGGRQVGYCRAVSDRTRFAWLADVFVADDHRGRGLGRAMVRFLLDHPDLTNVNKWLLGTRDAHGVYAALGFEPLPHPERFMQRSTARAP